VPAWISTSIALVALAFSLWTWLTNRRDSTKRDREARVARVNAKLVELSTVAHRASQGSAADVNALTAAQADLATAIAAAHVEFPACDEAATAHGVLEVLGAEATAFAEVAARSADLARGLNRHW
jgi:hypothetical protein